MLLTHPTGITEIYLGEFSGLRGSRWPPTRWPAPRPPSRTPRASAFTAWSPSQTREGEKDLAYAFDMAAMGQPLTPHLWAVLQWDWIE